MSGRFPLGTVLLVAVLALAVWKTAASVRELLTPQSGGATVSAKSPRAAATKEGDLIARLQTNDSLLGALTPSSLPSSPFSPRLDPGWKPPPPPAARDTVPPVEIPRVLLATVDAQSPEVVLGGSAGQSARLRVGSVWQGWTIVEISEDGVEIEGHGKLARLPVP